MFINNSEDNSVKENEKYDIKALYKQYKAKSDIQSGKVKSKLGKYKKLFERNESFESVFVECLPNGDLTLLDGDIKLINKYKGTDPISRRDKLNKVHRLQVSDIDSERGIVYVRFSLNNEQNELFKSLKAELAEGNEVRVFGKISGFNKTCKIAYVNIYDKNIYGKCRVKNWQHGFIGTFKEVDINRNRYYEFEVADITDNNIYLSRKELREDAWKQLDGIGKGQVCIVKCVKRVDSYGYYWGSCINLEDISIQVSYSNQGIDVVEGGYYRCVITEADKEKRILRAKTLGKVRQTTIEAISLFDTLAVNSSNLKKN